MTRIACDCRSVSLIASLSFPKGDFAKALEKLNAAIEIQEKLFDVPHEKLKSLQEKSELCRQLNLLETVQQIQVKVQECEEQMTQAKQFSNIRLERILDFANNNSQ